MQNRQQRTVVCTTCSTLYFGCSECPNSQIVALCAHCAQIGSNAEPQQRGFGTSQGEAKSNLLVCKWESSAVACIVSGTTLVRFGDIGRGNWHPTVPTSL